MRFDYSRLTVGRWYENQLLNSSGIPRSSTAAGFRMEINQLGLAWAIDGLAKVRAQFNPIGAFEYPNRQHSDFAASIWCILHDGIKNPGYRERVAELRRQVYGFRAETRSRHNYIATINKSFLAEQRGPKMAIEKMTNEGVEVLFGGWALPSALASSHVASQGEAG